jgi:lysozyme
MQPRNGVLALIATAALALAGIQVSKYEGTRYAAYQDSGGVWTICEGHTEDVGPGDTATPDQCAAYRQQDLAKASGDVDSCVHAELTASERAALIDFFFNVGATQACKSTLVALVNRGEHEAACEQYLRWVHDANGNILPGLIARRQTERNLCLSEL